MPLLPSKIYFVLPPAKSKGRPWLLISIYLILFVFTDLMTIYSVLKLYLILCQTSFPVNILESPHWSLTNVKILIILKIFQFFALLGNWIFRRAKIRASKGLEMEV